VNEVNTRALRQTDRVDLVSRDPLNALPRVKRRHLRGRDLAPLAPGEAVHEKGEAHVTALGQRRHELARVDL
jgi:hypothetical protein